MDAAAIRGVLVRLSRRCPPAILRLLSIAFSPNGYARKLLLVTALQLVALVIKKAGRLKWDLQGLHRPAKALRLARSLTEWEAAKRKLSNRVPEKPMQPELQLYCKQLDHQADNYLRLMESDDMYGLMFHLRSELIRSQAGGSGYCRDGNVAFRKHRFALDLINRSQEKVLRALRYIAVGSPSPRAPCVAERLAFVNETRMAFGRTALLLSGGAAFGFKHAGVLQALHRQRLLPKIISGTSAGAIAAAAVCVCDDAELERR